MSSRRERPTKEQLEQWYREDKMTLPAIAERCGVSYPAVRQWFIKHGIERRSNSKAQRISNGTAWVTRDHLIDWYVNQQMSQREIGKMVGVSQSTVKNWLQHYGIKARGKANRGEKNGMYGRTHTPEARAKIRAANLRQFSDPKARERHAILTCKQIAEGRTGKSYNGLETRVAAMFDEQGVNYVQQYRVGRYLFDFYLPDTNTLVEVHGTFWHADPRFYDHNNLSKTQRRNVENDKRKAQRAERDGYKLRIIWEHDVP